MNLLDHFHAPLERERSWELFHAGWAYEIAALLNSRLPKAYFAETQVHFGTRIEIDVAAFERTEVGHEPPEAEGQGGTAVLVAPPWVLTEPATSIPAVFPDEIEVLVYSTESGRALVAVVELVSPANKDRPEHRRAFAAKCAALLQRRVGLAVVDIGTSRQFNLHNELIDLMGAGDAGRIEPGPVYAVSYGPKRRPDGDRIDLWPFSLGVGRPLPVVPLPLDQGRVVPLDLGGSYSETCRRSRIG